MSEAGLAGDTVCEKRYHGGDDQAVYAVARAGTLYDALTGRAVPPGDRTVVFSPFGLGLLDLALARYVYDEVAAAGELHTVPGFFHETSRHG